MSFSYVLSAAVEGLHVEPVYVESDISRGLPVFHMVGYLSAEVREASERVKTALKNAGIDLPPRRIVMNLSPANVRKKGASFDLPMALSLMASLEEYEADRMEDVLVVGELGLDGSVKAVNGVLPIVLMAKEMGIKRCILPMENATEGALVSEVEVYGASHLKQLADYLGGEGELPLVQVNDWETFSNPLQESRLDFADVKGQESVKRATEIAVAGGHNLLFVGPPGSGKTMIAKRIPTILPPPTMEESLEITKIYSILGMVDKEHPLITGRPFRSVHHSVTQSALIGGGIVPKPGELSLAHGGVLFLDELAEFHKPVLELLRQPLEDGVIRITRSQGNYLFPADIILVAAMNPCPCGHYPDYEKCVCTPWQIQNYLGKISQPFLDRIDLCMEAEKISFDEIRSSPDEIGERAPETSAQIRSRVIAARKIQEDRYLGTGIRNNAQLQVNELEKYCALDEEGERLMRRAYRALNLTARTYHKVLKVARTIADLEGASQIEVRHLKEALSYRTLDKKYWGSVKGV